MECVGEGDPLHSLPGTPSQTAVGQGRNMRTKATHCGACRDLADECGPTLFPLYAKKLLARGWAGQVSPAENAYRQAHQI